MESTAFVITAAICLGLTIILLRKALKHGKLTPHRYALGLAMGCGLAWIASLSVALVVSGVDVGFDRFSLELILGPTIFLALVVYIAAQDLLTSGIGPKALKPAHSDLPIYIAILALIVFCSLYWIAGSYDVHQFKRKSLAKELGVNINNYSPRSIFPINYFYETLKPGMSSEEVHQIVRGYEAVFLCDDDVEFYYYFTTSDDEADRFEIRYDEMGRFKEMETEDDNSRTLYRFPDCVPGRLGE